MLGKKVKLTGKSRHGKNRVREQGEFWEVAAERDTVRFRTSAPGPFILIQSESVGPRGPHLRWVSIQKDPDFSVEIINE
jgi:hypothetical protein